MVFTPDSHRLVLSLYGTPRTLIIELPQSVDLKSRQPQVLRSFEHKFIPSFGPTGPQTTIGEPHEGGNGNGDDVCMAESVEQPPPKMASRAWVMNFAVSRDAQWLAVADSYRRVELFNLDTLQVSVETACSAHFSESGLSITAHYLHSLLGYRVSPLIPPRRRCCTSGSKTTPFRCSMSKGNYFPIGHAASAPPSQNASHSSTTHCKD
jgi:hypothetical protein